MSMGFLTGISFSLRCDKCGSGFHSAATGSSHPYNDYKCLRCNWSGM